MPKPAGKILDMAAPRSEPYEKPWIPKRMKTIPVPSSAPREISPTAMLSGVKPIASMALEMAMALMALRPLGLQ